CGDPWRASCPQPHAQVRHHAISVVVSEPTEGGVAPLAQHPAHAQPATVLTRMVTVVVVDDERTGAATDGTCVALEGAHALDLFRRQPVVLATDRSAAVVRPEDALAVLARSDEKVLHSIASATAIRASGYGSRASRILERSSIHSGVVVGSISGAS